VLPSNAALQGTSTLVGLSCKWPSYDFLTAKDKLNSTTLDDARRTASLRKKNFCVQTIIFRDIVALVERSPGLAALAQDLVVAFTSRPVSRLTYRLATQ
jgi:hypothetical protein